MSPWRLLPPPTGLELGPTAAGHRWRYRGTWRKHTEWDLRVLFDWCHDWRLAPLTAPFHDLELYLRWLKDVRRFRPVYRRLSVDADLYRTCIIDGVLEHSPADDVLRPSAWAHKRSSPPVASRSRPT